MNRRWFDKEKLGRRYVADVAVDDTQASGKRRPRDLAADPEDWAAAPIDDLAAERARQVAVALRAAVDGLSLRAVEARTGVTKQTVANILRGLHSPTIETISRLEEGLGVDLWPAGPPPAGPTSRDDDRGGG